MQKHVHVRNNVQLYILKSWAQTYRTMWHGTRKCTIHTDIQEASMHVRKARMNK